MTRVKQPVKDTINTTKPAQLARKLQPVSRELYHLLLTLQ